LGEKKERVTRVEQNGIAVGKEEVKGNKKKLEQGRKKEKGKNELPGPVPTRKKKTKKG